MIDWVFEALTSTTGFTADCEAVFTGGETVVVRVATVVAVAAGALTFSDSVRVCVWRDIDAGFAAATRVARLVTLAFGCARTVLLSLVELVDVVAELPVSFVVGVGVLVSLALGATSGTVTGCVATDAGGVSTGWAC